MVDADGVIRSGRRTFLKAASATLAGVSALATAGRAAAQDSYSPTTLTAEEMTALTAVLSRLLPADAAGGGAVEAGAQVYIDQALGGAYAKHLAAYRSGLAAVASFASQERVGGPDKLPPARLDALITQMERGKAPGFADGGAGFFHLIRQHMLEGVFGDPAYGGNRDYLGWKLIGFPGIQLNYTAAEQAVDGPRASRNRSMQDFGGKAAL